MFLLYHLFLAHVTSDFAFQPKELVNWKKKSVWGIIVHTAIFVVLAAIFCVTYLSDLVFISTLLVIAAGRGMISYINSQIDNIFTFIVGQCTSVGLITLILLIPKLRITRIMTDSSLAVFYNDVLLLLYLSFFTASCSS